MSRQILSQPSDSGVYLLMTATPTHRLLTGEDPLPIQEKLYESGKFGYSDKALDEDRFLGVAVMTLHKTTRDGRHKPPSRVVLLVPPAQDKWVLEQLDRISAKTFKHLKHLPGTKPSRDRVSIMIGEWFKVLFVMSRLLQLPEQPEAWTSFGFSKEDPIPDWMRDGLLTL